MPEPLFLTGEQAASQYGLSSSQIDRLEVAGTYHPECRYRRSQGQPLYRAADVLALNEEGP